MSSVTLDYDARASLAHRARRDGLRKAFDWATQLEGTLGGIESRYAIRCDPAKDDVEQDVLDEVYVLEDTMQQKLQTLNEHRNEILSPASRLNDDALQLIFHHVCTVAHARVDPLSPWKGSNIILSHVSRRWRAVALKMASLWVETKFTVGRRFDLSEADPWASRDEVPRLSNAERLNLYLERSKGSALRVGLSLTRHASFITDRFLEECRGRGLRAESMTIFFLTSEQSRLVPCLSSVNMTLKSLFLQHALDMQGFSMETFEELLRLPMPSLQHLSLGTVPTPSAFQSSFIALSNITKLDLVEIVSTFTTPMLVALLQCCPNLEYLSVSGQQFSVGWHNQAQEVAQRDTTCQRVSMAKLKSLTVQIVTNLFALIFDSLVAPKLVNLDYSLQMGGVANNDDTFVASVDICTDALCSFIELSSPPLQSIFGDSMFARHHNRLLRSMPTITTLTYSNWMQMTPENDDVAAQWLGFVPSACSEPSDLLCPALQSITYHGPYEEPLLRMCLQLVLERSLPQPPFSHVKPIRSVEFSSLVIQSKEGQKLEAQIGAAIEEFVIQNPSYYTSPTVGIEGAPKQ